MANKKTTGLALKLEEQVKDRLGINTSTTSETVVENEEKNLKIGRPKNGEIKKQKTFYVNEDLASILRKIAFDKECDQSQIVNEALEQYFRAESYLI